jgi:hypothetical protein
MKGVINMSKIVNEYKCPIRLMFGIGNTMVQGFSIVYEQLNGSAGSKNIWFNEEEFQCIKFVDDESYIKFNRIEEKIELSKMQKIWGTEQPKPEITTIIKEIHINRNFMNNLNIK